MLQLVIKVILNQVNVLICFINFVKLRIIKMKGERFMSRKNKKKNNKKVETLLVETVEKEAKSPSQVQNNKKCM